MEQYIGKFNFIHVYKFLILILKRFGIGLIHMGILGMKTRSLTQAALNLYMIDFLQVQRLTYKSVGKVEVGE